MTVRELRAILFTVNNQEMSVRQLRAMLFVERNQDEEIDMTTFAPLRVLESEWERDQERS